MSDMPMTIIYPPCYMTADLIPSHDQSSLVPDRNLTSVDVLHSRLNVLGLEQVFLFFNIARLPKRLMWAAYILAILKSLMTQ